MVKKAFSAVLTVLALICSAFLPSFTAQSGKIDFNNPDFIRGMDISSVLSLEQSGVKFYDEKGSECDLFKILAYHGVNYIRVRVWNDPFDGNGAGYGGGNCDVQSAAEIGRRAAKYGMKLLVDFHYSDFWADPKKQQAPKEWQNYSLSEKCTALYDFTLDSLKKIKAAGADIGMVQIGNETTTGISGEYSFDSMSKLFDSGSRAVREFDKNVLVALHFTNPERDGHVKYLADSLNKYGVDYDVFATSYYPFWHGTLDQLSYNMKDIAERYGKEIVIAEVSMGYTMEDYKEYEKLSDEERKGYATRPELIEKIDYPMTVEGQRDFMLDLLRRIEEIPNGLGRGFFWWEPAWIPVPGSGWATPASLEYIHDKGPCGNEWANQALFDYDGNVLPALEVIRDYQRK